MLAWACMRGVRRRAGRWIALAVGAASCDGGGGTTGAAMAEWQVSLEVGEGEGAFFSVWGASATELYAVGGQRFGGGLSAGTMWRFDGSSWREAALPADTSALNWVYGVGEARVAVGAGGTILQREGDDDAAPWTRGSCETVLPLWGVWGPAPDRLWAVGGDGLSHDPIVCAWDGATWTQQELPALSVPSKALYKVWGTAADDVWAVGDAGLILHYDGGAWSEVASGTTADVIALWGRAADAILAVGGRSEGVILRYDGAAWTPLPQEGLPGLNGVWMDGAGAARVVGGHGVAGRVDAGATAVALGETGTSMGLHAVFTTPEGRTFAVGGSIDGSPPFVGIILEASGG